ncbi:MAG: AMP-binding protein [Deltaproteobacteria bacterium]|nr:MAG: AMP-binding protein [Deltaproteobacteria bacterium]
MALVHSDSNIRYNYNIFLSEINRAARGLIKMSIKKGDRIALLAPNSPEWIISQMALAKIGAIVVPVDHGAGKEDLRYILEQSGSSSIIMVKGLEGEIDHNIILENTIFIDEKSHPGMTSWQELMEMGDGIDLQILAKREDEITPDDPVAIMYTSGTTGKPKGVVLDHVGLVNKSMFSALRQGLNNQDRLCLFFPLFHMFGNTCIVLAGLIKGASIIMPCATFEPSKIISAINKEKCTAIYGSPSMLITLIDHAEFSPEKWKTLYRGTIGGAPCPIELMRKLVEDIGISDITVAYGITEASSWITMTRPDDPLDIRVSTIGSALECNEVKILNTTTGEDLPPHNQGELCTRGFLMKGYYNMPAATASVVDKEGWFHTGDLGEMDEKGYVKITGRLKDVIVREGVEIYPTELEEIIYKLPGVSEVQVFGFPHPKKGQEIAAWVKLKEGADLSLDRLEKYVKDNFTKEKEPHYYKLVTEFPMTRSGKVQKFKLAGMAQKEWGQTFTIN